MNKQHISRLTDDELVKGLMPLINHQHWAYIEEFLLREQHKKVKQVMSATDEINIGRGQGAFKALEALRTLRDDLNKRR